MRRYKLLFIDDEKTIRESFLNLTDWESHHFEVAGVYKDGEEAWAYLDKNQVDIIVTDINMPFMDGIELLKNIRQKNYHARVIFLTGYEYFEYAQKAVQLRAFEFLLKPVTKEKLLDAVERAAFDIEKEEAVHEAAGQGLEVSRSLFFNRLLCGKTDNIREEAQKLGVLFESGSYLLMMATVDSKDGHMISERELEEWKNSFKDDIQDRKEKLEDLLKKHFHLYFAKDISPHIQIILAAEEKNLFSKVFIQNFASCLFELQEKEQRYRITLFAGQCRGKLEELQESLKKAERAAEQRHTLNGRNWKLIHTADYVMKPDAEEKLILPTDTLLHHIRMGMAAEVREDIKKIYDPFRHNVYISLSSAKMITTELAVVAFKGEVVSNDQSVSYLYYLNHIQQLNTLEELENDITQFAVNVANKRKNAGNQKNGIAERALEYLRQNYPREDLSLNDVADFLNISVPYLAVLFKQETGQNFGAHLLSIRMEKAKELLKTTCYNINEISERVGYSSSQYFSARFKKYSGVSPGVYREQ